MKKQKLKSLFKIGILCFGISILLQNCQKEDDNQSNSDLQNKNTTISRVSLDDVLNQNSFTQKEFGFKSKNDVVSKKQPNTPTLELANTNGLKKIDEGENNYVFLLERTDKTDNYFYNLVVREREGNLEKFVYRYPLDSSEPIIITNLGDDNSETRDKSIYNKPPEVIFTEIDEHCSRADYYEVTPCPCVGHTDPDVCQCPIQPVWKFIREYVSCYNPEDYEFVTIGGGSDSEPEPVIDTNNDDLDGTGPVLLPLPTNPDKGPGGMPINPLPVVNPLDITHTLDLTNLQRDWLEKLENQNFKSDIENYLNQYKGTFMFYDTQIFAQQAIIAWILNRNTVIDFDDEIIKDPSFIGTKADCVLEILLKQKGYFKEVMDAFTNNNSEYKIEFVVGPLSSQNRGADAQTAPPNESNIITITIAPDLISKDALEIAAVILHEGVHAQLHRILASGNKTKYNLSSSDYNWLLELEEFWSNNSELPTAQHDFMTVRYVDKLANSIRKFDGNIYPIENYMFFGWDGLYDEGRNRGLINHMLFNEYQDLVKVPLNDNNKTLCD